MFHGFYENVVRFASQGELDKELRLAKAEYFQRTGEMFESDTSFEHRIAAFLEWYVLDRAIKGMPTPEVMTPVQLFLRDQGSHLPEEDLAKLKALCETTLSLFEFRKVKNDHVVVVDLLTNRKQLVYERRKPAGLDSGDIIEARLVPYDDKLMFSDAFTVCPRDARRTILKAAKIFRKKTGSAEDRINLVHQVAYFSNRCERYKHVDPKKIFAALLP